MNPEVVTHDFEDSNPFLRGPWGELVNNPFVKDVWMPSPDPLATREKIEAKVVATRFIVECSNKNYL